MKHQPLLFLKNAYNCHLWKHEQLHTFIDLTTNNPFVAKVIEVNDNFELLLQYNNNVSSFRHGSLQW